VPPFEKSSGTSQSWCCRAKTDLRRTVGVEGRSGGKSFLPQQRLLRASLPLARATLCRMKTIQIIDPVGSMIVSLGREKRAPAGLRRLRTQGELLPWSTPTQNPHGTVRDVVRRLVGTPEYRQSPRERKNRDADCPSHAHSQTQPAAIAWPQRRKRRGPGPRSHKVKQRRR
jgi:hypothetical protein